MSAAHTPGPWFWRNEYLVPNEHSHRALGFSVHEKQNREYYATVIATPGAWGGAAADERQANARLIAAAPELLAALQAVVANSDRLQEAGHRRRGDINKLYDAAVSALAKATGEPA